MLHFKALQLNAIVMGRLINPLKLRADVTFHFLITLKLMSHCNWLLIGPKKASRHKDWHPADHCLYTDTQHPKPTQGRNIIGGADGKREH